MFRGKCDTETKVDNQQRSAEGMPVKFRCLIATLNVARMTPLKPFNRARTPLVRIGSISRCLGVGRIDRLPGLQLQQMAAWSRNAARPAAVPTLGDLALNSMNGRRPGRRVHRPPHGDFQSAQTPTFLAGHTLIAAHLGDGAVRGPQHSRTQRAPRRTAAKTNSPGGQPPGGHVTLPASRLRRRGSPSSPFHAPHCRIPHRP